MKYYLFEGENHGASIVFDASTLTPELIEQAIVLEEIPMPEEREGFHSVLNCNRITNEVWFEYIERPIEEVVEPIVE